MVTGVPASTPAAGGEDEDGRGALDIRLLGELQVSVDGRRVELLRSARARSLLAYLVLHPAVALSRQHLAFQFWPDSSEGQARTNLRNVLHTLRRAHPALDASVQVTTTTLQWQPAVPATVDVERFIAAVDAARVADPDDAADLIARCRTAVDLYGGELLEGGHDEWIRSPREALHDSYRSVLKMLATALVDDGRAGEATDVARALVRADPLDESAHRLRMEAHQGAGDRAGAVRAYHECVTTLERELGIGPDPVTTERYASLVEITSDDRPPGPQGNRPSRPGLVGRVDEWRQLVSAWDAAQHGPPAVVLLTGEPGVGKTRLADELRSWCAEAGATVAESRSYETEGDLGYAVVTSWLRSPDIQSRTPQLADDELVELARLLPELGPAGPADGAEEAVRRRRLFDVAVTALTSTARPTLLIADDAQWSDQASRELIHYLVRQRVDVPLLVVLTARHEDLDPTHPLESLRDALSLLDRLQELGLERLPRDATAELGQQLLGSPLDDEAIDALFAESEGNPLFIVETIRAGWKGRRGATPLSPRLRAVIDTRLRRLSGVAVTIMTAAAVIDRPCSARLLSRISGLEDRPLARGLDELWRRGILCEVGVDAYGFSHGKLREAAYDALSPAARRTHHLAVAEALAALVGHDSEITSSQVAVHFEAANRPDEAVMWYQRAALEAQRVFAHEEAVRLLDRALALVPALAAHLRHGVELELLSTLPVALAGIDGYATDRMRDAHRRAADVAEGLGVELDPAFVRSMVMSALCRDEFAEAAEAAGRLLDHATGSGDTGLRLESHYLLGISAFWQGDLDRAREHFETVVEDFDPSMRPRHHVVYGHDPQVVCLSRLASTLWFLGRDDDARSTCDDALSMAARVGHVLSHDTALVFSCLLAVDLGDDGLLRRWTSRLAVLSRGSVPHTTKLEALLGLLDVLDGDTGIGIRRVRAALDRCQGRNFYPGFQATIIRVLLAAHAAAGDAAGGLETCARALAMGGTPLWVPEVHRARAEFLHEVGAGPDTVEAELTAAEAVARSRGADGHLRRVRTTRERLAADPSRRRSPSG